MRPGQIEIWFSILARHSFAAATSLPRTHCAPRSSNSSPTSTEAHHIRLESGVVRTRRGHHWPPPPSFQDDLLRGLVVPQAFERRLPQQPVGCPPAELDFADEFGPRPPHALVGPCRKRRAEDGFEAIARTRGTSPSPPGRRTRVFLCRSNRA